MIHTEKGFSGNIKCFTLKSLKKKGKLVRCRPNPPILMEFSTFYPFPNLCFFKVILFAILELHNTLKTVSTFSHEYLSGISALSQHDHNSYQRNISLLPFDTSRPYLSTGCLFPRESMNFVHRKFSKSKGNVSQNIELLIQYNKTSIIRIFL